MIRKKYYQRILAAVVASVLIMGTLSGCGAGKNKESEETGTEKTGTEETNESVGKVSSSELSEALKEKYAQKEDVSYTEGQYEIARDEEFLIECNFDPVEAGMDAYPQIAALYEDRELTREIPATYDWVDEKKQSYTISPFKYPRTTVTLTEDDPTAPGYAKDGRFLFDRGEGGDWGNYETMYLAQWVDTDTGEKLEKPLVSVVTIKGELETPKVKLRTTENGIAELIWNKIPGATEYYVLEISMNEEMKGRSAMVIARTTDTRWSDKVEKDSVSDTTWKANSRFANYLISEDDWLSEDMIREFSEKYDPAEGAVKLNTEYTSYFTVMAVNKEGTSMFGDIYSGDEIARLLPCTLAIEMEKQSENGFSRYVDGIKMMPAYRWIIRCDGALAQCLVEYDMEAAVLEKEKRYTYEKEDMSDMEVSEIDVIKVPYTVQGTPFGGTLVVENYDAKKYEEQLKRIQERQEQLRSRSGTIENEVSIEHGEAGNEDEISGEKKEKEAEASTDVTIPEDKITANTALSEYIAVNMINSVEEIDITAFPEAGDQSYLADAWAEALYQNPLTLGVSGAYLSRDRKKLVLEYEMDKKTREKQQEEIREEVTRVTNEIIKEDMSDLEKEYAINDYLCENGEYDYDALTNAEENEFAYVDPEYFDSFTAYGILVNKEGVCSSYAASFKLLADAAGLDSVVVTGYLNGALPHAWNRVKLDGNWDTLDVTNNDMENLPNAILNIPDAALGNVLVEDEMYAMDDSLEKYVSTDEKSEFYLVNEKYYSTDEIAQEFANLLKEEKTVVLRTDYRLTDAEFYDIGNKVIELTGNPTLGGFYWMGVIVITSAV